MNDFLSISAFLCGVGTFDCCCSCCLYCEFLLKGDGFLVCDGGVGAFGVGTFFTSGMRDGDVALVITFSVFPGLASVNFFGDSFAADCGVIDNRFPPDIDDGGAFSPFSPRLNISESF